MVPPTPMRFAALGSLWYGELLYGMCRALTAPWLEPWWFARGTQIERRRASQVAPGALRLEGSSPRASEPPPGVAASDATIIRFDRARARIAATRAAGSHGPGR